MIVSTIQGVGARRRVKLPSVSLLLADEAYDALRLNSYGASISYLRAEEAPEGEPATPDADLVREGDLVRLSAADPVHQLEPARAAATAPPRRRRCRSSVAAAG